MTRLVTALTLALVLAAPAFAQSASEPATDTPTAPIVSEEVLERHVGGYELQPGVVLSITRDANRLFAQAPGQDSFELAASSETEFSVAAFEAQITFNQTPDGITESLTLRQNGVTITAGRVE
ncbi:MAG: DUF3471 domain-containing protein [Bacteroidota bacterium]